MPELPRVSIPGTSVSTTVLGFGCSNLLGDKTRAQGLHLLQTAFDAGVRHFDVARYYGFGEAESVVADLARGRREEVTIATKFGLQPAARLTRARTLIRAVRRLMQASPRIRALVRRKVHSFVQAGRFDVPSARASLETSLRALDTDYIDLFLLHEGTLSDCSAELLDFLEQARREGKILAFGIASTAPDVAAICEREPAFSRVAQFPSSLTAPMSVPRTDPRLPGGTRLIVNHGVFSDAAGLAGVLRESPATADRLRRVLDTEVPSEALVAEALLRAARRANPTGVTVFSSTSPGRIRSNVDSGSRPALTDEQHQSLLDILGGRDDANGPLVATEGPPAV